LSFDLISRVPIYPTFSPWDLIDLCEGIIGFLVRDVKDFVLPFDELRTHGRDDISAADGDVRRARGGAVGGGICWALE
jgi:hypothetical protein